MCLIINREKGSEISKEFLEDVRKSNPDGWGILYHNREGKVKVVKGLDMDSFWKKFSRIEKHDAEAIIHFRLATKGVVNEENAHPYLVLAGKNPIYLMHNGTIDIEGVGDKTSELSDTRVFIRDVLQPTLSSVKDPHSFIRSKHFEFIMESIAGDNNSRFVLFDHQGPLFYGGWYQTTKKVWVSNTYAYTIDNAHKKPKTSYYGNKSVVYGETGYWDREGSYQSYGSYSNSRADDTFKAIAKQNVAPLSEKQGKDTVLKEITDDIADWNDYLNYTNGYADSIEDVTENFTTIAKDYWGFNDDEIDFCMQNFFTGLWEFSVDEVTPTESYVFDEEGEIISAEDILVAYYASQTKVA
jgi:hypothetical protein